MNKINMNYLTGNLIDDFVNSGISNTNQFIEQAHAQFDNNIKRNAVTLQNAQEVINNVGVLPAQLNNMANAEITKVRKNQDVLIHNLQVTNKRVQHNANKYVRDNSKLFIEGSSEWIDDRADNISETFGNELKHLTTPIHKIIDLGEETNKNWDNTLGAIDKTEDTLKNVTQGVENITKYAMIGGAVLGAVILLKK